MNCGTGGALARVLGVAAFLAVAAGGTGAARASVFDICYAPVPTRFANTATYGFGTNITVVGHSESGSAARIHEIYFETGLDGLWDPGDVLRFTVGNSPAPHTSPAGLPEIIPDRGGQWTGLDLGKAFPDGTHEFAGIGDGQQFGIVYTLMAMADNLTTESLLSGWLDTAWAMNAMYAGNCDDGGPGCVIDSWSSMSVVLPPL